MGIFSDWKAGRDKRKKEEAEARSKREKEREQEAIIKLEQTTQKMGYQTCIIGGGVNCTPSCAHYRKGYVSSISDCGEDWFYCVEPKCLLQKRGL